MTTLLGAEVRVAGGKSVIESWLMSRKSDLDLSEADMQCTLRRHLCRISLQGWRPVSALIGRWIGCVDSVSPQPSDGQRTEAAEAGEVITHLAFYAGWPNAFSAVAVAKDGFENARAELGQTLIVTAGSGRMKREGRRLRRSA